MKFEIGDKVKDKDFGEGTVIEKNTGSTKNKILVEIKHNCWYYDEKDQERLKLIKNYTNKDLKKSPIGTKVTFENGEFFIKTSMDRFENDNKMFFMGELEQLESSLLGKIIKVEEPEYKTVYENKEILDEAEKRYLRGVIRPFKDKVKYIKKCNFSDTENIKIGIKKNSYIWEIRLPPFEKDMMYKNMEDDKQYTLEELGI